MVNVIVKCCNLKQLTPNRGVEAASNDSLDIFEIDKLLKNLSLSKSSKLDQIEAVEEQEDNSVKSVKEQAKKLNRINTESNLEAKKVPVKVTPREAPRLKNKVIELEYFDLADPKPLEKEWILVCSRCNYMDMARILSKEPYLAQKKDPFTVFQIMIQALNYF